MVTLPLPKLKKARKQALRRLLATAGGTAHLARMLGYHYMTVKGWEERGMVSRDGAIKVEEHPILGETFTKEMLRPDLY